MEDLASPYVPGADPGWRRFVVGLVLRSLRTVVGYALGGLALFAVAAIAVDRSLVGEDPAVPFSPLAVLYVLLGGLAGANVGLSVALRRGSASVVARSSPLLGPVLERALSKLAVPKEGISPARLRELAELSFVTSRHQGLSRLVASFAVRRAIEDAGLEVLQRRLLGLADQADTLGHSTVGRELIEAAARDGLSAAIAQQLDVGWRANLAVALAVGGAALASLPVLAAVAL